MHYLTMWFFDIYPYLCGTVFLIGSWLRYDYGQYTWCASSSQMLDKKGMRLASNLFTSAFSASFFGHLLGLLTPHWVYQPFLSIGKWRGGRRRIWHHDAHRRTTAAEAAVDAPVHTRPLHPDG